MIRPGIVYVTRNLVNNKIYVGVHTRNMDGYLGSGYYLRNAIRKYGKENFIRTTIDEFDEIEIGLAKETYWIGELNSRWPSGYNLNDGGRGQFNPCEEVREKMSFAKRGKPSHRAGKKQSPESRAKMSQSKKELFARDPAQRERMIKIRQGRPHPNLGKKYTPELKEKLRLSHLGLKDSVETKERKSIAATKAWARRNNDQGGVLL